jgi:LytS/YehU family sensor histidine kinase
LNILKFEVEIIQKHLTVQMYDRTMPGMEKESGVGIENVRKQLRLLYPERHNFQISDTDGVFTAEIKIAVSALKTDAHSTKNKNNEQYNKMRDNR